jgi:hypothetical protein
MAFKLDKQELASKAELIEELTAQRSNLDGAIEAFNDALTTARDALQAAIDDYNDKLEGAREFAGEIAAQADSDMSDKSERWLEGDRGQNAEAWKSEWENATFEPIEIDMPDEISCDADDHAEMLDQLPDEMDG